MVYHEKQSLYRCGIHTVNNILQSPIHDTHSFDSICSLLLKTQIECTNQSSFINPYKNPLSLGNYDVSVLEIALQQQGYSMKWLHNKFSIKVLIEQKIKGFVILKRKSAKWYHLLSKALGGSHWYAITNIDNIYYNLDSKIKKPIQMNDEELINYLNKQQQEDNYLFVVDLIVK